MHACLRVCVCVQIRISIHRFYHRSGASATGCRHQVKLGERYLDLRQNPVLGEAAFYYYYNYFFLIFLHFKKKKKSLL
jgi:hypothetical protein